MVLIGQRGTREKLKLRPRVFPYAQAGYGEVRREYKINKVPIANMGETPKKACISNFNNCRCCNSRLSNVYDRIDLFGRLVQKENIVDKLKQIACIEVQEEDVDFFPTSICRKCFRKILGLHKAMQEFSSVCSNSKLNQEEELESVRLKRGRKPCSATKEPQGKRRQFRATEFTVRHFDSSFHVESSTQVASRVRTALFPTDTADQRFLHAPCEILPALPVETVDVVENSASTSDQQNKQLKPMEILKGAGLRNSEVGIICYSFEQYMNKILTK